jgi:hypothetical protein
MSKRFNKLTEAQAERLALLLEECGEAQQAIGKILRHGYENYSPFDDKHTPNRIALMRELGHIYAAVYLMFTNGDVDVLRIRESRDGKLKSVGRWLHHKHRNPEAK